MALRPLARAFSVTRMPLAGAGLVASSVAVVMRFFRPFGAWAFLPLPPAFAGGLLSFPPFGAWSSLPLPTAYAVGCILAPLRGWVSSPTNAHCQQRCGRRLLRFGSDWGLDSLLFLPVANGGADCILSQHRAVDLHRRKRELLHNVHVLDGESFVHGFTLDPLGGERGRGNGGAAAEGLELGVFNDVGFTIDLDLQLHDVAALGRADQAGAYVRALLIHRADVARIVVVIDDLIAV